MPSRFVKKLSRLARFARAEWDWAAAGFRTASEQEIDKRYLLCRSCEEYVPDKKTSGLTGECGICECRIVADQIHLSKIARANETCPLLKWKEEE